MESCGTDRKFLKLLELLQLEYKSWDSPTAETEEDTLTTRGLHTKHSVKMLLCSHGFQSALSPVMDFYRPVCSLRPQVRPLLQQQELMDKLQHKILEEVEPFQTSVAVQMAPQQPEREGELFGLTLDTRGFSPEELTVRQAGRRLRVSGRTEKKQEDDEGSCSYRRQEFRREFDLPEGLNPEAVSCYLDPDGKLHVQVARAPRVEEAERELSIKRRWEEKPQQS